jgi:plastocyanin
MKCLFGRLFVALLAVLVGAAWAAAQDISGLTLSPNPVLGGKSFTGTVTLSKAAGTSGVKIALTSSALTVATVPASVTVASGAKTATFTGSASYVTANGTAKIEGVDPNKKSASATLTVDVPSVRITEVAITPATVEPGQTVTGTVTLSAAAPSSGFAVKLASNSTYGSVPASVTVKSGAKTATFAIESNPVPANETVLITGTDSNDYKAADSYKIDLPSVRLTGIEITPSTVTAANPAAGKITLSASAPSSGFTVRLSSLQTYVGLPSSVSIPSGASSITFAVLTYPVSSAGTATVTAKDPYGYQSAADLTVKVPTVRLTGFSISPSSVSVPATAMGTIGLSANAPSGGFVVDLSTMQSFISIPMTVTVVAGTKSATFTIKTSSVAAASTATIQAVDTNGYGRSASLSVNPQSSVIQMTPNFTFSPQSITLPAGTVITFTNTSMMDHAVLSDISTQSMNSGAVGPGASYTWTLPANAASGATFYYHCPYHGTGGGGTQMGSGMAGVIIVQ